MALTSEQAEGIKKQLFSQIENSQFPNKEEIKKQIQDMNEQELEEFLKKQQKMAQEQGPNSNQEENQCIFCSIINKETQSYI